MGYEGSGDRVFQQRGMNCPSDSESLLYGSNWDQIVSLNQSGQFGNSAVVSQNEFAIPHCSAMLENQAMGSSSQLVQFPSDPSGLVDIMPRIPGYGSEIFSEMVTSPYGKRKREVIRGSSPMNAEGEQRKDSSGYTSENPKEDDEKKQKVEKSAGQNSRGKQASKLAKDNADDAEPSKENYIHLRAKRGQATNSHSLAERVRREKISERMRLLQELVPGCNKITGKAMMLDEIINYVQSLQQQVEFLSMKLATVNPELNVDLDRILSKDILQLRSNNVNRLGIAPGLGSAHPFPKFPQGPFNGFPGTSAPFQLLPQHIWNNNELQGLFQMGFDPDPSVSMGQNGMSKTEL